ncbi:MAG: PAS domain S-box protein, partial [Anaerolineae bacterium]|nr:PAS domain S-box protein [Anaerolineae bacterium]
MAIYPQSRNGWVTRIRRFFARLRGSENPPPDIEDMTLYCHLIEASPSGMILVDAQKPDQPIISVNDAFERTTGYIAEEVVGRNCRFLQGDDTDQPELTILREALKKQRECVVTLRNYRKDGSMFWNELRLAPIRNRRGVITHFIGIQNDVTERKQMEEALRQSETRYRQMFENNRAIKMLIDPESGKIVQANQSAADYYGYDVSTLQRMFIHEINNLSEAEIRAEMKQAVAQERTIFQFRHKLASGEIRDVDVFSSPIDTTDGQLLYSIVIDVDEKHRMQHLYESLFQQSNDAVFMLNMEGQHVTVNQRAADMLGYTTEEIISLSYKDLVIPVEQALSNNVLQRMLAGETIPPYERTFCKKDGTLIPTEINVEIVRDSDGTPMYLQSIVRDITERKRMENALRESEHRLRSFVEHSSDGVVMVDEEGHILEWNQSMEALTDITAEEAIGHYLWDIQYALGTPSLQTTAVYEQIKQTILELLQKGQANWLYTPQESLVIGTRGTENTVQAVMFPIPTKRGFQAGSVLRNISEQKRYENALRKSESRLRAMIEAIPDTIFRNKIDGTYLDWHAPDESLLIKEPERFIGHRIQDTLPEPIASEQMEAIHRAIKTGHVATHEFVVPLKDMERHFEVRIVPSGNDEVVSIARDVTDIRQAQQRELELFLEKERLRLLTTFIQDAAHEFRTPLA